MSFELQYGTSHMIIIYRYVGSWKTLKMYSYLLMMTRAVMMLLHLVGNKQKHSYIKGYKMFWYQNRFKYCSDKKCR